MHIHLGIEIIKGMGEEEWDHTVTDSPILSKMSTFLTTAIPVCKRQIAGKLIFAR